MQFDYLVTLNSIDDSTNHACRPFKINVIMMKMHGPRAYGPYKGPMGQGPWARSMYTSSTKFPGHGSAARAWNQGLGSRAGQLGPGPGHPPPAPPPPLVPQPPAPVPLCRTPPPHTLVPQLPILVPLCRPPPHIYTHTHRHTTHGVGCSEA